MLPALLVILGSVCFVTINSLVCPPPEDISPCVCTENNVFCHKANTKISDLKRMMKKLEGQGTFDLSFRNLNIQSLPLQFFKNLSINVMEITDCKLEGIVDRDMKRGYDLGNKLRILKIVNSINDTKENFRMELLSLKTLVYLEITHNNIPHLRSEFFELTPSTVTQLKLKENRIETIGGGAFAKLTSLEQLVLEKNRILHFTRSTLPILPLRLNLLDLSDNNMSFLPIDLFWDMPFLTNVYIDKNNITDLSERTWRPVWSQLDFIAAHGNPLICDSRIEWMFKIRGPRSSTSICKSPPERRGKSLETLIRENRKLSMKKLLGRRKVVAIRIRRNNQKTFV